MIFFFSPLNNKSIILTWLCLSCRKTFEQRASTGNYTVSPYNALLDLTMYSLQVFSKYKFIGDEYNKTNVSHNLTKVPD